MNNITLKWTPINGVLFDVYRSTKKITIKNRGNPIATAISGDTYTDIGVEEYKKYKYAVGYFDNDNYILSDTLDISSVTANIFEAYKVAELGIDAENNTIYNKLDPYTPPTRLSSGSMILKPPHPDSTGLACICNIGNGTNASATVQTTLPVLQLEDFTAEIICMLDTAKSSATSKIFTIGNNNTGSVALQKVNISGTNRYRVNLIIAKSNAWNTNIPAATSTTEVGFEFVHLCLMRKNGIYYTYINGNLEFTHSADAAIAITNDQFSLFTNNYTSGIFDSFRLVKGAIYDINGFTKPAYLYNNVVSDTNLLFMLRSSYSRGLYDDSTYNHVINTNNDTFINFLKTEPYLYSFSNNTNKINLPILLSDNDFTIEIDYIITYNYNTNNSARLLCLGYNAPNGTSGTFYISCLSGNLRFGYANFGYHIGGANKVAPIQSRTVKLICMRKNNKLYMAYNNEIIETVDLPDNTRFYGLGMYILSGSSVTENTHGFTNNIAAYNAAIYQVSEDSPARLTPYESTIHYEYEYGTCNYNEDDNNIDISFEYNDVPNGTRYNIYRSTFAPSIYNRGELIAVTDDPNYIDNNIDDKTQYFYSVSIRLSDDYDVSFKYIGYTFTKKYNKYDLSYLWPDGKPHRGVQSAISSVAKLSSATATGFYPEPTAVGPYNHYINKGFCRTVASNTTANNTVNGRISTILPAALGTDDFTFEMVLAPFQVSNIPGSTFLQIGSTSTIGGLSIIRNANTANLSLLYNATGSVTTSIISSYTIIDRAYINLTLMRKNGIFYVFINGQKHLTASAHTSLNLNSSTIRFFANETNIAACSAITDTIKLTRSAIYDINGYTIPDGYTLDEYSPDYNTVDLFLDFLSPSQHNNIIRDKSRLNNLITTNGTCFTYSTHIEPMWYYMQSSYIGYTGIGSYIYPPGNGDYTLEYSIVPFEYSNISQAQVMVSIGTPGVRGTIQIVIDRDGTLYAQLLTTDRGGVWVQQNYALVEVGKVYNICVQRLNGASYIYANGSLFAVFDGLADNVLPTSQQLYIGAASSTVSSYVYHGLMSDVTITKGTLYPINGYDTIIDGTYIEDDFTYIIATYMNESIYMNINYPHDDLSKILLYKRKLNESGYEIIELTNTDRLYIDENVDADTQYEYIARLYRQSGVIKSSIIVDTSADEIYDNKLKLVYTEDFSTPIAGKYLVKHGAFTVTHNTTKKCLHLVNSNGVNLLAWTHAGSYKGDVVIEMEFIPITDSTNYRYFSVYLDSNKPHQLGYRIGTYTNAVSFTKTIAGYEPPIITTGYVNNTLNKPYKLTVKRINKIWYLFINGVLINTSTLSTDYTELDEIVPGIGLYASTVEVYSIKVYN